MLLLQRLVCFSELITAVGGEREREREKERQRELIIQMFDTEFSFVVVVLCSHTGYLFLLALCD